MAGNKPEQGPSIGEILASIRQIISDDREPRQSSEIETPKDEKPQISVYQKILALWKKCRIMNVLLLFGVIFL
jgi:hypothetical protein